ALLRNIPVEDRSIREGGWQQTVGMELDGRTLGLLGLGRLGTQVAAIGRAFGMPVIAWSQNVTDEASARACAQRVTKDELFSDCDVLSIHSVLSERTRGLVGERELELMRSDAYLVNTSRGRIVDEDALRSALQQGRIAG